VLQINDLVVNYGVIAALQGVTLAVPQGAIVTLIGANGAGKTTTLRTVSGLLRAISGEVLYRGESIANVPAHQLVRKGIAHVPEGRMVFANLTVHENLMMGAYLIRDKQVVTRQLAFALGMFPRLKERERQMAGTLSGGEQQMLAIARALMSCPRFLMLDEPSLGLRRCSSKKSSKRSGNSTGSMASRFCWWNRTPILPWRFRVTVTCWKPAVSCCRTRRRICGKIPR